MRLAKILTGHQTISLLDEGGQSVALALCDQQTGAIQRVTITADVTVDGPREPSLMITIDGDKQENQWLRN